MAYTDEQKRQHILELQAYLHGISHQSQLPHLIPDGVYGENTANAVRLFQQQNQLPPTGETDTATWNAIAQAYRQEVRPTVLHLRLFPTGITAYAPGDKGSAVL
ncbi:MAG: peptidoglycan-binding domain-containing protein [Ruminococcus callidus]